MKTLEHESTGQQGVEKYNDILRRMLAGEAVTEDDLKFHVAFQNRDLRTGLKVGETIPDFELKDQNAKIIRVRDLIGRNGMIISFARTAHWCPYCRHQLKEIETSLDFVTEKDVTACAITPDSVAIHKTFADENNIRYPLLSDPNSNVIEKFGIINHNITREVFFHPYRMPFPGNYFVDRNGVIVDKAFLPNYEHRQSITVPVMTRFGVSSNVTSKRLDLEHAEIITSLSVRGCFPGQQVGVECSIRIKEGRALRTDGEQGPPSLTLENPIMMSPFVTMSGEMQNSLATHFLIKGIIPIRWSPPPVALKLKGLEHLAKQRIDAGVYPLKGAVSFAVVDHQGHGRTVQQPVELPLEILPPVPHPRLSDAL